MTDPVLIVGGRGAVGALVLQQLLADGVPVRASTRRLEPGAFPPAVDARQADLTDPSTLGPLLDGVVQVFLYAVPDGADRVAAAIAAAGVRRVVLLSSGSVLQPQAADNAIAREHARTEQAFAGLDVGTVPIRPLVLAGNALGWAHPIRAGGRLPLYRPEARTAPVHERDIAAVVVEALRGRDDVSGMLTGPERLSQAEQAEIVAAAVGRSVEVQELSRTDALQRFSRCMPAGEAEAVLQFLDAADGGGSPVTDEVERVLGRAALPFADWAAEHVADFR